jgi:hypothetical protein
MNNGSHRSQKELLQAILDRASTDRAFRQALLDDPQTAIRQAFGMKVVDGFRLKFVEKDPDLDALVVLPGFRGAEELSEAELDRVAGGMNTDPTWAVPIE